MNQTVTRLTEMKHGSQSFTKFILETGLFQTYKGKGLSQGSLELRNTHTSCLTNCGHTQILWSTSRHGCYLHCDGPFLPFFPAMIPAMQTVQDSSKHTHTQAWAQKLKRTISLSFLLQLSNMRCSLSGSRHNTTALCWCLCICWVHGRHSCKLSIHAIACTAPETHTLTTHSVIWPT